MFLKKFINRVSTNKQLRDIKRKLIHFSNKVEEAEENKNQERDNIDNQVMISDVIKKLILRFGNKVEGVVEEQIIPYYDNSVLYGLKFYDGNFSYLLFFPRCPRNNKFLGSERIPQDVKYVIMRINKLKNNIEEIWVLKNNSILHLGETDGK